jgi:hypothetical protein
LEIAQPAVSKHLKILEEADLVGGKKDGLWVNYHLAVGSNSPYGVSLLGKLKHWLDDDPEVTEVVGKPPSIRRERGLQKMIFCNALAFEKPSIPIDSGGAVGISFLKAAMLTLP